MSENHALALLTRLRSGGEYNDIVTGRNARSLDTRRIAGVRQYCTVADLRARASRSAA